MDLWFYLVFLGDQVYLYIICLDVDEEKIKRIIATISDVRHYINLIIVVYSRVHEAI